MQTLKNYRIITAWRPHEEKKPLKTDKILPEPVTTKPAPPKLQTINHRTTPYAQRHSQ